MAQVQLCDCKMYEVNVNCHYHGFDGLDHGLDGLYHDLHSLDIDLDGLDGLDYGLGSSYHGHYSLDLGLWSLDHALDCLDSGLGDFDDIF